MQSEQKQLAAVASYRVVKCDEGRAAVWPSARPLPHGWTATDMRGSREECLAYIQLVGDVPAVRSRVDTSVAVA